MTARGASLAASAIFITLITGVFVAAGCLAWIAGSIAGAVAGVLTFIVGAPLFAWVVSPVYTRANAWADGFQETLVNDEEAA